MEGLLSTEYLAADSAVMFSQKQGVKFFIATKTVADSFVLDPFLFWANRTFDTVLYLLVHRMYIVIILLIFNVMDI